MITRFSNKYKKIRSSRSDIQGAGATFIRGPGDGARSDAARSFITGAGAHPRDGARSNSVRSLRAYRHETAGLHVRMVPKKSCPCERAEHDCDQYRAAGKNFAIEWMITYLHG